MYPRCPLHTPIKREGLILGQEDVKLLQGFCIKEKDNYLSWPLLRREQHARVEANATTQCKRNGAPP